MYASALLPFPALVGLERAQQALMLLAIEPRLRGVVLAASAGTGKSSLARGIRDILDDGNTPFVELPSSIDVDNLLGGVDLEATLRTGSLVMQPGVLARADGGIVYVDGINLLDDSTANLLLSVVDEGRIKLEREGVSWEASARFSLIGSYDPSEGVPRQHLLDRVGLIVPLIGQRSAAQRESVVRHNLLGSIGQWEDDRNFLRGIVLTARDILPGVTITAGQIEHLCDVAFQYGVEGHRADVFAVYAACAAAASELRESVNEDDLTLAAQLVIIPRATRIPQFDDQPPPPPPQQPPENQQPPDLPPPENDQSEPDDNEETDDVPPESAPPELLPPPDQILEALATALPEALEDLPFINVRRGRSGSRGATEGRRGRHVRSIPGDPAQARIDVVSTLRTAAPWQPLRRSNAINPERTIFLDTADIRVKRYRSKAGALFCFAVDASGSMALHRMRQAKGALHALLEKAYVKRDRVSLIAFRGQDAELLLPPTQSVELARRALDLLPTGGGTPLASALLLAADVAAQARMRGIMQTVLVLLTDGRANVPLEPDGDPQAEIENLAAYIREIGMRVIVVDTKRSYLSRGEARQLAETLGGDYAYLPNASGEEISEVVTELR